LFGVLWLPIAPRFFTSSYSFAYNPLSRAFGPLLRNCVSLSTTKVSTFRTQPNGSFTPDVGLHCPGSEPTGKGAGDAGYRPSPPRESSIVAAASSPTATPAATAPAPSSAVAVDRAEPSSVPSRVLTVVRTPAVYAVGRQLATHTGIWSSKPTSPLTPTSTPWAAVAAAAACDAPGAAEMP
jgi:hypothetical protein